MRGKPAAVISCPAERGLIPAHAGKTSHSVAVILCETAHPRACGENPSASTFTPLPYGSSPRMRGKPQTQSLTRIRIRLIPAHAGKTAPLPRLERSRPAHPRACGENQGNLFPPDIPIGSSPRMRGKRAGSGAGAGASGLIPAHAGKTSRLRRAGSHARAHPRACGENRAKRSSTYAARGSSPRMRGKRLIFRGDGRRRGLIPAHAGKTRDGLG